MIIKAKREDLIIVIEDNIITSKRFFNVRIPGEFFLKKFENTYKFRMKRFDAIIFLAAKNIIQDKDGDYWYHDEQKERIPIYIEDSSLDSDIEYAKNGDDNLMLNAGLLQIVWK